MSDFDRPYQEFLDTQKQLGRWRELRSVGVSSGGRTDLDGRKMINFSSNNYMGLAQHPLLIERACEWAERYGAGAMASRLVCGTLDLHEQIEQKLIEAKGGEACLIFNSGFQGNAAILSALLDKAVLGRDPLVFCDRLNHASMHAGLMQAGVRQIRYRHNDLNHLESLLRKHEGNKTQKFIVSESVFSMDGDRAPVDELIELANRFGVALYLDEAHAMGVLGEGGFGLCAHKDVAFKMGTFSKALGGFGAYLVCSQTVRDYLINKATGLIYTTALPPSVLGAMDAALELVPTLGGARNRLLEKGDQVRLAIQRAGFSTGESSTQIVPAIIGDENETVALSQRLFERGILGVAIRPPTVPHGQSRIRLAITAAHSDADINYLCACLDDLGKGQGG